MREGGVREGEREGREGKGSQVSCVQGAHGQPPCVTPHDVDAHGVLVNAWFRFTLLSNSLGEAEIAARGLFCQARPSRASVYRHTSKFKDTPRWRQKNDSNSEYILVVRRDQIFQSSGPGTYPRASRKAPPVTFADESYEFPK